jgi:hypothetical protein
VTIYTPARLPDDQRERIKVLLAPVAGVDDVRFVVTEQETLYASPDAIPLPASDLFEPVLADPKEPHFYTSYRWYDIPGDTVRMAAVGFGERFGFIRQPGDKPGDGWQLSIAGGVLAQFNLDAPSADLVNADYIIGLPITYRRGPLSARLRVYHQSSHLGDEFLLNNQPERINLSYESIEFIGSYDYRNWRVYGGGEYIFHREPNDLKPGVLHTGIEYLGPLQMWKIGRVVAGIDLKNYEHHDWNTDFSINIGVEFGRRHLEQRRVRVLFETFKGFAPHGQFYEDKIDYAGVRVVFGF